MTETWIVATDFSECSDAAVLEAARLAAPSKSTLRLFHVHDAVNPPRHLAWGDETYQLESDLRARLARIGDDVKARHPGIDVEIGVATGDPAAGILAEADRVEADHIVVGTHGRTGIAHLVLGSVAERVVRAARVPVIVVKGRQ